MSWLRVKRMRNGHPKGKVSLRSIRLFVPSVSSSAIKLAKLSSLTLELLNSVSRQSAPSTLHCRQ
jgi:hypothetical protein